MGQESENLILTLGLGNKQIERLLQDSRPISIELLVELEFPGYETLRSCLDNSKGQPAVYASPDLDLIASKRKVVFLPNSCSTGGKTTIINHLVTRMGLAILAKTIKTGSEIRKEELDCCPDRRISLSNHDIVIAQETDQYVHVKPDDFEKLQNEPGFFIGTPVQPWGKKVSYGIARFLIEEALNKDIQFVFCSVDGQGQIEIDDWIKTNNINVITLLPFYLPTNLSFKQLADRISGSRPTQEVQGRIIDAANDIYTGASTGLVICNPFSPENPYPSDAIESTLQLMKLLRPEMIDQDIF